MKTTVIEIRAMLAGFPDDLPVEFVPITDAWLGANHPIRVQDASVYADMEFAMPTDKGAALTIYLHEDSRGE